MTTVLSTSSWDAKDYARVGGFVPALGAAALDLLAPQPGEAILDVAQADGHVLILGETGTGKSLIAAALHACGPRAAKPRVTLNCASAAPETLEPMLFGGPDWPEKSLIDQAEGGTLCLEEVDALPHATQARLLETINATDPTSASTPSLMPRGSGFR